jgi:hypothetical protein
MLMLHYHPQYYRVDCEATDEKNTFMTQKVSPLQTFGVIISVVNLIFILYFFVDISMYDHSYISTNLERYIWFRVLSTLIITVQGVLVMGFFARFRVVRHVLAEIGIVLVIVSLAGWYTLASVYTHPTHMIGFGIYVTGLFVYWFVIFMFDKIEHFFTARVNAYFLCAFCFGLIYVVLYVTYNDQSWFYEHMGMVFACLANISFFIFHNVDPRETVENI